MGSIKLRERGTTKYPCKTQGIDHIMSNIIDSATAAEGPSSRLFNSWTYTRMSRIMNSQ